MSTAPETHQPANSSSLKQTPPDRRAGKSARRSGTYHPRKEAPDAL